MERQSVKTRAWILRGISTGTIGVGLAVSGSCMAAVPAPPAHPVNTMAPGQEAGASTDARLALKGTALLAHAERILGVDGNPDHMIDRSQYDQIRDYFLKQIAATPAKREKLWQPDFSSPKAYESSVSEHRQHLRRHRS